LRSGALALEQADMAHELVDAVGDPIIETSFLSGYAASLALAARYGEAELAAEQLRQKAEQYRLDFAIPYALCASAMALTGQRQWCSAEDAASDALALAQGRRDVHAELLSRSILRRLYAQQGRLASALALPISPLPGALKVSIAEAACSRALVLSVSGRVQEALELIGEVRASSSAIEPVVLIHSVEAICALQNGAHDAFTKVEALRSTAFETGALDLLVMSYRACPEILSVLLRTEESHGFRELVERVGDADLAAAVGHPLATNDDRRLLLSPREREVFELLRNGFTNRQIAKLLFIEQSTVKAHAHHIYDKLGVRSRNALTVQAALERSAQATSAIESTLSDKGSS
jgi:DNA-binding NarL/FixJ family response regulator